MAVMQHARDRSFREEVYRAYVTRSSSGDLNNTKIINEILKLRLEKAVLLGCNNYAEVWFILPQKKYNDAFELIKVCSTRWAWQRKWLLLWKQNVFWKSCVLRHGVLLFEVNLQNVFTHWRSPTFFSYCVTAWLPKIAVSLSSVSVLFVDWVHSAYTSFLAGHASTCTSGSSWTMLILA